MCIWYRFQCAYNHKRFMPHITMMLCTRWASAACKTVFMYLFRIVSVYFNINENVLSLLKCRVMSVERIYIQLKIVNTIRFTRTSPPPHTYRSRVLCSSYKIWIDNNQNEFTVMVMDTDKFYLRYSYKWWQWQLIIVIKLTHYMRVGQCWCAQCMLLLLSYGCLSIIGLFMLCFALFFRLYGKSTSQTSSDDCFFFSLNNQNGFYSSCRALFLFHSDTNKIICNCWSFHHSMLDQKISLKCVPCTGSFVVVQTIK